MSKLSDEIKEFINCGADWCEAHDDTQLLDAIRDLETRLEVAEQALVTHKAAGYLLNRDAAVFAELACSENAEAVVRARIEELEQAEPGLFDAIKHGAEDHQQWLKGMLHGWFTARIANLKKQLKRTPNDNGT